MRTLVATLVVAISTACFAEDMSRVRLNDIAVELYDVSDLSSLAQDCDGSGKAAVKGFDMVEVVKTALSDITWGTERAWIRGVAGVIEVRGNAHVQARVGKLLDSMRANRGTMIEVDTMAIEFDLDHRAEILRYAGMSVSRKVTDSVGGCAILSPLQAQVFLAHVGHESDGGWLIASPRLTLFHAQQASLTIAQQTAYLRGYDGVDPVVGAFTDGLFLDLRVLRPAEGSLCIAGTARATSLLAVEKLPVTLANGAQAVLEMPRAATEQIAFDAEMKEGESLLLLGGPRHDDKAAVWLITPSVIPSGPAPR